MKIHKSTLHYLKTLKTNNNRAWFSDNKDNFIKEQTIIKEFHKEIMNKLNKHDKIDRYKLYRIYRDVRFSKDKTPYQPHFAAGFYRNGITSRGSYYLRIRPNNESLIGGGFWQPNKEDLQRIRKEFEIDSSEIRTILSNNNFINVYGKLQGDELKSAPRGFDKNHADIDLIRKKGFIAVRKLTDKEVLDPNFIDFIDDSFKTLRPFFDLMSNILTTDLNGESTIILR